MTTDSRPLAERLRPERIDEIFGQDHLIGADGPFSHFIKNKTLPSIILWGPPGVGKTTLASVIAKELGRKMFKLSAINSGVKEVREVIAQTKNQGLFSGERPILFIDEIHRFSKSQQDSLLEAVEKGTVTLIGATTENPSFEVISALLSRCQVYVLKPLSDEDMETLLANAIEKDAMLSSMSVQLKETEVLKRVAGGDGRKLLNALDVVIQVSDKKNIVVDNALVEDVLPENLLMYDKGGDMHYDIASALIKSIRGSDPQAAVYWLARMIDGGEDPKFIARRLLISASEDIGLANPNALLMANTCFDAVSKIGWPESRIILSQCAIYLATSAKSNSAYMAIGKAQEMSSKTGNLPVPLHLRNAQTSLMKDLGYGENYKYSHDGEQNFLAQDYLPEEILQEQFYNPGNNPAEQKLREWMKALWPNKGY